MRNYITEHKEGIIGSILFHMIVLAIIVTFGLTTPLPLPAEEGILIDFGDSEIGLGENLEKSITEPQAQPTPPPTPIEEVEKEQNMTQDFEEAPVIEKKKEVIKKKVEKPKPNKKPVEKTEEIVEIKKEEIIIEERKANQNAMFPGNKNNTGQTNTNQGNTSNGGNQGVPDGEVGVNNYNGTQSGGGGISFSLAGRTRVNLPKPSYNINEGGIVVVKITVNREGIVTNAEAGVQGSTTLNENLLNAAKRAALSASFDRNLNANSIQSGTITYVFRLQ